MALEYSLWGIGKRPAGMVSNRQKLAMSEVKNSVDGRSSMRFDLDRCRIVTGFSRPHLSRKISGDWGSHD